MGKLSDECEPEHYRYVQAQIHNNIEEKLHQEWTTKEGMIFIMNIFVATRLFGPLLLMNIFLKLSCQNFRFFFENLLLKTMYKYAC